MKKNAIAKGIVTGALVTTTATLLWRAAYKAARRNEEELPTVDSVDLNRYTGRWYEIAKLPARFENDCVSDVTATYTLRDDGKVDVLNQCRKSSGELKTAHGTAKVVDYDTNAKLKVTFFWPFYGDYWILELGADYEYAVIGEPSRKYLWILSRTPQIEEVLYQSLLERIARRGFSANKLIKTHHTI